MSARLSAYERARLRNIARNNATLRSLGLAENPMLGNARAAPATNKKRKRKPKAKDRGERPPPSRRSKRQRGTKPDYTGEKIDHMLDAEDRANKTAAARQAAAKTKKKDLEQILAESRRMMVEARASLLAAEGSGGGGGGGGSSSGGGGRRAASSSSHAEAVRRWGPLVGGRGAPPARDEAWWRAFVASRTSRPPPNLPSPLALMQEEHCGDVWRLLCACVLMSRVSSHETKARCIAAFFARFPTPSAFAAPDTDPSDVLPLIQSLGLPVAVPRNT